MRPHGTNRPSASPRLRAALQSFVQLTGPNDDPTAPDLAAALAAPPPVPRVVGATDTLTSADGRSRTDATTYPLSSLIHYRLSAVDAALLNADKPGTGAHPGDIALLVAMHVAGREITRWTWQTFWWTPAPDDPRTPSSAAIASLRPNQLRGAARNNAMALAYTMLIPDQPHVRGENSGAAVYTYNPWIEARFSPADLPDSLPGLDPNGQPATNNFGVHELHELSRPGQLQPRSSRHRPAVCRGPLCRPRRSRIHWDTAGRLPLVHRPPREMTLGLTC